VGCYEAGSDRIRITDAVVIYQLEQRFCQIRSEIEIPGKADPRDVYSFEI